MNSKTLLTAIVSLLLVLAAECACRPPWPGSDDPSKDRTGYVSFDGEEDSCGNPLR